MPIDRWIELGLAFAIALAALTQCSVSNRQWIAATDANRIANQSLVEVQRAFVVPSVRLVRYPNTGKVDLWRAYLTLENAGSTPADNVQYRFNGVIDYSPDPEQEEIEIPASPTYFVFKGGEGILFPKQQISIADSLFVRPKIAEIIRGRGAYFIGDFTHKDAFSKEHFTKFCLHVRGAPWVGTIPENAMDTLIDNFDLTFFMCQKNNCTCQKDQCAQKKCGKQS